MTEVIINLGAGDERIVEKECTNRRFGFRCWRAECFKMTEDDAAA